MPDIPDTTAYQTGRNGPLTPEIHDFLMQTRDDQKWSYAVLGKQLGMSGTFIYNLLNNQARISTTYLPKVIKHIERLRSGDFRMPETADTSADPATGVSMIDHPYNLRSGVQISVRLPEDLTEREAERLALFVRSLAN